MSKLAGENSTPGEAITQLLREARQGDPAAADRAYALIYRRLHESARAQLRHRAGGGATLTPTALVNEAWLKLVDARYDFKDREHYLAIASNAMRQIVVDAARAAHSARRGGDALRVTLQDEPAVEQDVEVLRLEAALQRLEKLDARLAQVVLYRYFAGLSEAEIARLQGVTDRTVRRDWRKARAFLHSEIRGAA